MSESELGRARSELLNRNRKPILQRPQDMLREKQTVEQLAKEFESGEILKEIEDIGLTLKETRDMVRILYLAHKRKSR